MGAAPRISSPPDVGRLRTCPDGVRAPGIILWAVRPPARRLPDRLCGQSPRCHRRAQPRPGRDQPDRRGRSPSPKHEWRHHRSKIITFLARRSSGCHRRQLAGTQAVLVSRPGARRAAGAHTGRCSSVDAPSGGSAQVLEGAPFVAGRPALREQLDSEERPTSQSSPERQTAAAAAVERRWNSGRMLPRLGTPASAQQRRAPSSAEPFEAPRPRLGLRRPASAGASPEERRPE